MVVVARRGRLRPICRTTRRAMIAVAVSKPVSRTANQRTRRRFASPSPSPTAVKPSARKRAPTDGAGGSMTRWLGWSVLAAGVIAAGYLAALNPAPIELNVALGRVVRVPLGVVLTGAMAAGAVAIGVATLLIRCVVLLLWIPLGERPGMGTIANPVIIAVILQVMA